MEMLTSRQVEFVKLLLEENEYKPIKYFTEKLNVSDKTLQKDLKININVKKLLKKTKYIYLFIKITPLR